jgi:5'-3' exonuclease
MALLHCIDSRETAPLGHCPGRTWERFHKVLHQRLNDIIDKTGPRKTVMLAADGPAPLAKLITQRERRKVRGFAS